MIPTPKTNMPLTEHENLTEQLRECGRLFHQRGWSVGTSSNPNPPSDGYTKNWLHFITVSLGVEFEAVRR